MYKVSFEISAFILCFLCLIYSLTAKRKQYKAPKGFKNKLLNQHFVFLLLLISNMLSSASSVIGVYLTDLLNSGKVSNLDVLSFWQYFFHALYFIFHATLSICFALYIMNVNGASTGRKKVFYILFSIPYILSEIIILTNSFTSFAFYMDEANVYHRGPLMPLLYGLGAIYVVLAFVFFFSHKRAISKADSVAIVSVISIAVIGIVTQALVSNFLVELFFESLAFVVLMVLIEEKRGHIDTVTGLYNRVAFSESNRRLMDNDKDYNIIIIDVKNTDVYSNRFGTREFDQIYMKVASWLSKEAMGSELFFNGQNEFAILRIDTNKESDDKLINDILERFKSDWDLALFSVRLDALCFIINVPQDVKSLEELEDFLSANYTKNKTGSYLVTADEIAHLEQTKIYERTLKRAIDEGNLLIKLQPIWSIKEQKTIAAEALLRVKDESLYALSPDLYIPTAEKTGLIKPIGLFVFEEVCKALSSDEIKSSSIRYIELNLSIYQFMYDDLVSDFEAIRKKYGVDASLINLEITETAQMTDFSGFKETIEELIKIGYTFSLDDFGQGYSNMVSLINSKYKNVKIDKSILWDTIKNEKNSDMLRKTITFLNGFCDDVIQEGVETKEQLELVSKYGCDLIQGYYFSRPLEFDDFVRYIKK